MEKIINKYKLIAGICFVIYLVFLFKVLFFKYPYHEVITAIIGSRESALLSFNLVPFRTIIEYLSCEPTLGIALRNLIGNVVIFVPFGFLLPLLLKSFHAYSKILLASLVFSLFVETLQAILRAGSFDVDDLILNTLGGLAGLAILKLTRMPDIIKNYSQKTVTDNSNK